MSCAEPVRIVDAEDSTEADARSDELQIPGAGLDSDTIRVTYLRCVFPKRKSLPRPENLGDTLSG